jgi:hypothetical protein
MATDPSTNPDVEQAREKLHARVDNDFTYHPPQPDQVERYNRIRDHARGMAHMLVDTCPPSRELSIALTDLESCVFNANAAIARNERS